MEKTSKPKISDSLKSIMSGMMKKFSPEKLAETLSTDKASPETNQNSDNLKAKEVQKKNNKSFFTSIPSETSQRVKIGDGIATIASKIYSIFSRRDSDQKKKLEIYKDFEHEKSFELKKEYDKILDSVDGSNPTESLNKTTSKHKKSSKIKKAAIATAGLAGGSIIASLLNSPKNEMEEPKHSPVSASTKDDEARTEKETKPEKPTSVVQPYSKESYKEFVYKKETGGRNDPYNTMNKSSEEYKKNKNSNVVIAGNTDIDGKTYSKNLTDMTLQEVVEFGEKRKKRINSNGMGGASGKYQFMPIALEHVAPKVFGNEWKKKKFSPENQELLMDAFVDYQESRLKREGLDVNNASMYLHHVFGNPKQVSRIINAKDDQKMKELISHEASKANPEISEMTVKEYKNKIGMSSDGKALPTEVSAKNLSMSRGFKPGHEGIDYAANEGTQVRATKDGKVIQASMNPSGFSGYGNVVVLDHGDGTQSLYAHLSSFNVAVGDEITQGQNLGGVGSTGKSTGNHLHYEVRKNGKAVDPETNKLSIISPVGNKTSLAQNEETGNVLNEKIEKNKSLKNKNNTVSINNPTNTVVGKKQETQILSTGSLNDVPLLPKFVLPNNTQMS